MSDNNMSLKMRIDTSYDGKGTKSAARDVENLDKKQSKTNKTVNASKASSISASQGFASVGQAASAAASGGLGPLSGALGGLTQQLPMLAGAAGPIALVIAAFAAWKSVIDSLIAGGENLEKNLTSISLGNTESGIKRLNDAYKDLTDQLAAASSEINRFYNAESAKDDAVKRVELAKVDLDAAKSRAKLDPANQFASQRLELDIAKKKAAIEDAAGKRASAREQKAIQAQTVIAKTEKEAAVAQRKALPEKAAKLMADQEKITSRATDKAGKWYRTSKGEQEIWDRANTNISRIASALEDVKNKMVETVKAEENATAKLSDLQTAKEISKINQSTQAVQQAATQQGQSNTSAGINYNQRQKLTADRTAAQEKIAANSEQKASYRASIKKEWNDVRNATPEQYDKEMDDWRDATAALNKFVSKAAPMMKELKETADRATQALNNLP